ncbi:hypothetical protein C4D60_Mb01t03160 [Musa balbisiana]|uniref:GATA-type domain-containing protein n=1 Tax=Musa balbisiana TaxID=52838 RepID=A0A4S8JJQ6_MUSBA|nr:hypothetical protein C4D60_Mb01t03160 [Musa balbisiana]
MMSTAIRTAARRNWGSRHGRRAAMDGVCDRRVTVKRYTRRRVKAAVVKAADAVVHTPPRVCADCRTSETPLWRSGPGGPKVAFHSSVNPSVPLLPTLFPFHPRFCVFESLVLLGVEEVIVSLCNACGIKYRKRRKGLAPPTPTSSSASNSQVGNVPAPAMKVLSTEELKRRQREKQERTLKLLLLQHRRQRRSQSEEKAAVEAGKEVEEAARLLLSLSSSGLLVHS